MPAVNLQTVDARNKLKPRRDPYFATIRKGCALGFRKMTASSTGTWVARCLSETTDKQQHQTLGEFSDKPAHQRYGAALEAAEAFFKQVGMGATLEVKTVKDACEAYIGHLRTGDGDQVANAAKADEAAARFGRTVYSHPIAKLALSRLTMGAFEKWRKDIAARPVVVNPHAPDDEQQTRGRAPATVNRDIVPFRAAMNYAHERGHIGTDVPWLSALKPAKGAGKARDVYLTRQDRRALIAAAQGQDTKDFVEGMCMLPFRPGALAALTVGNFDKRAGVLTVGKDKSGRDRKLVLPQATADKFRALCKDKLPAAPIFARANGKPWDRHAWKDPIKAAVRATGVNPEATAYCLRHSTITDLVPVLDLLTVAQLAGTSVAMIEKHYGHLKQQRATDALEILSL